MKPNFKDNRPFSKHLFAVDMGKTEIIMNKSVCLGQAILDVSKTLMYAFHYDYMKPRYGSKDGLCYMDTNFSRQKCISDVSLRNLIQTYLNEG